MVKEFNHLGITLYKKRFTNYFSSNFAVEIEKVKRRLRYIAYIWDPKRTAQELELQYLLQIISKSSYRVCIGLSL